MKNKNITQQIINEYDAIAETPGIEVWKKFENSINMVNKTRNKKSVKLPSKILATVAALVFMVGLFNIQTVMAFIGGLFFAPGAGVTQGVDVTYYGLEKPIDIETDYGILTLKFANKITKGGNTSLSLYLYSLEIPWQKWQTDYPIYISIAADGENIGSGEMGIAAGSSGSDGINYMAYSYACENFPEVTEFTLIFDNLGVETPITLYHQPGNFALSKENNGITLAVSKFNNVTDMLAQDIYDSSENAKDYNVFGRSYFDVNYYGEDGEEIRMTSGWGGYDPDSQLNYQITEFYKNEREIKSLKTRQLELTYNRFRKEPLAIEIPVPKDGETIKVNIELPIGSHTFRITELRREGDTIYYKSNSHDVLRERANTDVDTGSFTNQGIPNDWDEDKSAYEQAVANNQSFIQYIAFSPVSDLYTPVEQLVEMFQGAFPKMGGGQIWSFDENAESLTFYFAYADIIQFGEFSIEFE